MSATWPAVVAVGCYLSMSAVTLGINVQLPVTPGLALMRAALWPLWLFTPLVNGTPLPMD